MVLQLGDFPGKQMHTNCRLEKRIRPLCGQPHLSNLTTVSRQENKSILPKLIEHNTQLTYW